MRKKIVAGNWKMNTCLMEGEALIKELIEKLGRYNGDKKIIVAPPYTHLHSIGRMLKGTPVELSSQNCAHESSGAFTGEVSVEMLVGMNVSYVIIGHSERRQIFNETDEMLNKKIDLALKNGLSPIFCIGEQLEERENGKYKETVKNQLESTVFNLAAEEFSNIILAYEPVWAIGTGKVASPEQAQEMHEYIRHLVSEKFEKTVADETSILYGGSCKPNNAKELFGQPDVDGGLIGGASLKADDFYAIINA